MTLPEEYGDDTLFAWYNVAMHTARISVIAAIGKNRELGKENGLIWRIKADLARVKALTMGHPLIMGRKTYESIGRPLPGRTTIIVSRNANPVEGCIVASSLADALTKAHALDSEEIFIFGGAQIYAQALPVTDRLYLTCIDAEAPAADTFFPEYAETFQKEISREEHVQDGLRYTWVTCERT